MASIEERRARGTEIREKMFGGRITESLRNEIRAPSDVSELYNEITFGEIWSRPVLDLKTRSLITIAVLTALGKERQLFFFIQGALNIGVTREEVEEVIRQMFVYAGAPAMYNGFHVLGRVFAELEQQPDAGSAQGTP